jgi:hypothetical protein
MKKLILTFGIILAGLLTVNAQSGAVDGKSQTDKILNEYTSVANLTPDQVTKIRPLLENFYTTRKENKEKYASDREGLKTANKANRDNLKSQMDAILTADQVQKIDDYNKAKKERNKEREGSNKE